MTVDSVLSARLCRRALGRYGHAAIGLTVAFVLVTGCYQQSEPAPQEAIQVLASLLHDREASVRHSAAEALGKIGDQSAEPLLVESLHDADARVREASAQGLSRLSSVSPEAATELVSLLRDTDPVVRRAATQALAMAEGTPALASSLERLLSSVDVAVRQSAAQAFFLFDSPPASSLEALSNRSRDSDPVVRRWAVAALGESGDPQALAILVDRLRHDPIDDVRAEAAYRLRFVGNASIGDDLRTVAERGGNGQVRRWAETSLGAIRKESGCGSALPPDRLTAPGPSRRYP